jgi:hypothetical protein
MSIRKFASGWFEAATAAGDNEAAGIAMAALENDGEAIKTLCEMQEASHAAHPEQCPSVATALGREGCCSSCNVPGVHCDTQYGEIVVDGVCVATVYGETVLVADPEEYGELICRSCFEEYVEKQTAFEM